MPRVAGLALWLGFVPVALMLAAPSWLAPSLWGGPWLLLFAVSLKDDVRSVGVPARLVVHLAASAWFAWSLAGMLALPWWGGAAHLPGHRMGAQSLQLHGWQRWPRGRHDDRGIRVDGMGARSRWRGRERAARRCGRQRAAAAGQYTTGADVHRGRGRGAAGLPRGGDGRGRRCRRERGRPGSPCWHSFPSWPTPLRPSRDGCFAASASGNRIAAHYYQRLLRLGAGHTGTLLAYGALMLGCAGSAIACALVAPDAGPWALAGWCAVHAAVFATIDYHWRRSSHPT